MKIWQQIAGYNVEMGKIATKIKPMPLWISSPKQWFKWLSEMSTILHPLKITLYNEEKKVQKTETEKVIKEEKVHL